MSDPQLPQGADQKKLDEIVSKDEKSGRSLKGFWSYLVAAMGVFMVLFYMWCAAEPVDTQYFLGCYVLLTYVMIMLNYPSTAASPRKIK
ncbi:MAG: hypothetical protein P8X55_14060, partial [Desulfosarcinaceae bacterium]